MKIRNKLSLYERQAALATAGAYGLPKIRFKAAPAGYSICSTTIGSDDDVSEHWDF
jgi:hypothetical protein